MPSKTLRQVAKAVSILGHPLLTISVLVYYLSHRELPSWKADIVSGIIIGGIAVPIILHNAWKTGRGKYANFDVSDQGQRRGFFIFVMGLLAVVSLYCWWMQITTALVYSMWIFWVMVAVFAIVNRKYKISLHAGVNFYIAAILLPYGWESGLCVLLLAVLVAASRLVLGRHTLFEIVVGASIGFAFGWVNTILL
ncbi:MAG: phosphatase PAP2 family protein [Chitinophagaceae bacterium]